MHAHLACIETAEENEFLRRLLKEIRGKLQLLKSEITVSIANKTSFYKIIDVLNDITFHKYICNLCQFCYCQTFFYSYKPFHATLLYYSGPRMLARSERTPAPRYRDLRVGVDPAGLYQIRLVRWGAGESPLGEPPMWDVLPGLRLPLARGGLY